MALTKEEERRLEVLEGKKKHGRMSSAEIAERTQLSNTKRNAGLSKEPELADTPAFRGNEFSKTHEGVSRDAPLKHPPMPKDPLEGITYDGPTPFDNRIDQMSTRVGAGETGLVEGDLKAAYQSRNDWIERQRELISLGRPTELEDDYQEEQRKLASAGRISEIIKGGTPSPTYRNQLGEIVLGDDISAPLSDSLQKQIDLRLSEIAQAAQYMGGHKRVYLGDDGNPILHPGFTTADFIRDLNARTKEEYLAGAYTDEDLANLGYVIPDQFKGSTFTIDRNKSGSNWDIRVKTPTVMNQADIQFGIKEMLGYSKGLSVPGQAGVMSEYILIRELVPDRFNARTERAKQLQRNMAYDVKWGLGSPDYLMLADMFASEDFVEAQQYFEDLNSKLLKDLGMFELGRVNQDIGQPERDYNSSMVDGIVSTIEMYGSDYEKDQLKQYKRQRAYADNEWLSTTYEINEVYGMIDDYYRGETAQLTAVMQIDGDTEENVALLDSFNIQPSDQTKIFNNGLTPAEATATFKVEPIPFEPPDVETIIPEEERGWRSPTEEVGATERGQIQKAEHEHQSQESKRVNNILIEYINGANDKIEMFDEGRSNGGVISLINKSMMRIVEQTSENYAYEQEYGRNKFTEEEKSAIEMQQSNLAGVIADGLANGTVVSYDNPFSEAPVYLPGTKEQIGLTDAEFNIYAQQQASTYESIKNMHRPWALKQYSSAWEGAWSGVLESALSVAAFGASTVGLEGEAEGIARAAISLRQSSRKNFPHVHSDMWSLDWMINDMIIPNAPMMMIAGASGYVGGAIMSPIAGKIVSSLPKVLGKKPIIWTVEHFLKGAGSGVPQHFTESTFEMAGAFNDVYERTGDINLATTAGRETIIGNMAALGASDIIQWSILLNSSGGASRGLLRQIYNATQKTLAGAGIESFQEFVQSYISAKATGIDWTRSDVQEAMYGGGLMGTGFMALSSNDEFSGRTQDGEEFNISSEQLNALRLKYNTIFEDLAVKGGNYVEVFNALDEMSGTTEMDTLEQIMAELGIQAGENFALDVESRKKGIETPQDAAESEKPIYDELNRLMNDSDVSWADIEKSVGSELNSGSFEDVQIALDHITERMQGEAEQVVEGADSQVIDGVKYELTEGADGMWVSRISEASSGDVIYAGRYDNYEEARADYNGSVEKNGGKVVEEQVEAEEAPMAEEEGTTRITQPALSEIMGEAETQAKEEGTTRITQAALEADVLDESKIPVKKTRTQSDAKQMAIERNVPANASILAASINQNPRPLMDFEEIGFAMRIVELNNMEAKLNDLTNKTDDPAELDDYRVQENRIADELNAIGQALYQGMSEWGRSGRMAQIALNKQMNIISNLARAKRAKGGELTAKDEQAVRDRTAEYKELTDKIAKLEAELSESRATSHIKGTAMQRYSRVSQAEKDSELDALINETLELQKRGCVIG